ncbi:MAG: hypothetical protein CSA22_10145 [Deltaproteobacteria bacterium]|nr:MAG: hypothetical protein CSA22_10145 [Deltaproteobacteria bacterium]
MSEKIARLFITTGLFFLVFGCIEGLMFPTKMKFQSFYATLFHIPPVSVKGFFGHFVAKIHTHVNLVGWVGSVLMGLLYFQAPKISGRERFSAWSAYLNWGGHTLGLLMMVIGFHLIGFLGLSAGFTEGTPEFRQVVSPAKLLVISGGVLVTLSVFLFVFNIMRTLFASSPEKHTSLTGLGKAAAAVLLVIGLALPAPSALAAPAEVAEQMPVIMVGDRLVDVAHKLGVVPMAMSVRCSMWPLCDQLKSSVKALGCPGCLLKKKAKPLFTYGDTHGIKRVFIENSKQFCMYKSEINAKKIGSLLKKNGYEITYVDFTNGLAPAVKQTAALIGKTDQAAEVIAAYETALEKTRAFIKGKTFAKTVVIIRGTYQKDSGKAFTRIEVPGGYADTFLLDPLGVKNVGHLAAPEGKKPSKGHIQVRKLNGLITAAPDAIILTGDALAVQKALYQALKKYPALANVPALKQQALFSLPGYVDSSVLEYPDILKQWADYLMK